MTKKLTLGEVDQFVLDAISVGKQTNRLPLDFTMTPRAEEGLKDMIRNKIEDPTFDNKSILATAVGFLIGYSVGLSDMANFVENIYNK